MKATIDATGFLRIQAETELEAYALSKWSESLPKNENLPLLICWGLQAPIIPLQAEAQRVEEEGQA